jgi:hypothetical protein
MGVLRHRGYFPFESIPIFPSPSARPELGPTDFRIRPAYRQADDRRNYPSRTTRALHPVPTYRYCKAGENVFAPKIKMLGLKAFAPDDAFFLWPIGAHFPFAFSRALKEIPNRRATLRMAFGDRFMRSAICSSDLECAASSSTRRSSA